MKPLSHFQNTIFVLGGILLIVGALAPLFTWLREYAPYIYTCGALMFSTMQLVQRYEGQDIVIRRLRRQQMLGAILIPVSVIVLLISDMRCARLSGGEWKLVLLIAVVLELYTAFRLPQELEREQRK